MKEIRRKLLDSNPTVAYHTLCVLDSVMKNCASDVHSEVLSHEFLAVVKEVITSPQVRCSSHSHTSFLVFLFLYFHSSCFHSQAFIPCVSIPKTCFTCIPLAQSGKNAVAVDKALELIGEWNSAFGQQAGYKAIHDTFGELEREGFVIPEAQVASAAFIQKVSEC